MSQTALLGVALVLMLAAYPLTAAGGDTLLFAGLAALGIGALIPPLMRFTNIGKNEADASGEEEA